MSDEMKPCPFCGGEVEMKYAVGEWWASCTGCSTMKNYRDSAVKAWNSRPVEDRLQERVKELEGLLEEIEEEVACHLKELNEGAKFCPQTQLYRTNVLRQKIKNWRDRSE